MTYEELRAQFPENFEKEKTLHEMLDETRYTYEDLSKDVKRLSNHLDEMNKILPKMVQHLKNAVVGVEYQDQMTLIQRAVRALVKMESTEVMARNKVFAIINALEQAVGEIPGVTTADRVFTIDLEQFKNQLTERDRDFFESCYIDQGKDTKAKMSPRQYKWMNSIFQRVLGCRFEEVCFFSKRKDEDVDSELE
jgi:hypothetical protein